MAREQKEQKETEVLRDPILNKKFNQKIPQRTLIERLEVDAKAKKAKLQKMKDTWITQK